MAARPLLLVVGLLLWSSVILLAFGAPERVPGAPRGVFDRKLARAESIRNGWIEDGHGFRTITDADYPYGFCLFGKPYAVSFNITIPTDDAFVRVDQQQGYAGVLCNLDHTDMEIHFASQAEAQAFQKAAAYGHPVLTGAQGKAECSPGHGMFKRVAIVDNSIAEVPDSPFASNGDSTYAVRVRSFRAQYDHIIESGTISFGVSDDERFADVCQRAAAPEGDAHFCIGLNTDEKCTGSAGPIVFYQNEYVTLECADCWLAFSMDVGLKMKLEEFLLYDSHFAFDNMVVKGALVAQMLAQYHWGLSYDATIPIIDQTDLVQFWLGPIPISFGFELPLQRVADASFDASAQAEAGAEMQWNLGRYMVLWDPIEGWRVDQREPGLVYKTTVSGEAQFDGSANFGLAPSLTAYLDSFFTTQVAFSAMLHANVQGSTSSKSICADVNYDVIADGSATLDISIPWIDLDESWTWSKVWFSKSGTIAQACVGAKTYKPADKIPLQLPAPPVQKAAPATPTPSHPQALAALPPAPHPHHRAKYGATKFLQGQHAACFNKRGYSMSYDVVMAADYNLLDLTTFPGLRKLRCNAGGNTFLIEFERDSARKTFFNMVQLYTTFLTGTKAMSDQCKGGVYDTTVFLFRVSHLKDTSIPFIKYQAEVEVSPSRYDEVFQHANMSFSPDASVRCGEDDVADVAYQAPGKDEHVCLGVNANRACNAAKGPLTMYKGDHLTVECTNCFFALETDIFFELHIKDYWVHSLAGGFRNMSLDAAMVLQAVAEQSEWSAGTNITEDAVAPTTIVDFAIGPIPVRLWFEIPLRRLAEVQVNITAAVAAGVLAQWQVGDYYVSYQAGQGWTHVAPRPSLAWKPYLGQNPQASFNASALLGLIPTFAFHVDSVFWTELTIDPEVLVLANGSLATRQVCASAQGQVRATAYAELDINVPFIYLHVGAWWGPETVYDSGVKQLGAVCHKFSELQLQDAPAPYKLLLPK